MSPGAVGNRLGGMYLMFLKLHGTLGQHPPYIRRVMEDDGHFSFPCLQAGQTVAVVVFSNGTSDRRIVIDKSSSFMGHFLQE